MKTVDVSSWCGEKITAILEADVERGWGLTRIPGERLRITHMNSGYAIPQSEQFTDEDIRRIFSLLPDVSGKTMEEIKGMEVEIRSIPWRIDEMS